jgi:hypothetical protein
LRGSIQLRLEEQDFRGVVRLFARIGPSEIRRRKR